MADFSLVSTIFFFILLLHFSADQESTIALAKYLNQPEMISTISRSIRSGKKKSISSSQRSQLKEEEKSDYVPCTSPD